MNKLASKPPLEEELAHKYDPGSWDADGYPAADAHRVPLTDKVRATMPPKQCSMICQCAGEELSLKHTGSRAVLLTSSLHVALQAAKQARKDVDKNRKERSKLSSKPPDYLSSLQQEVDSLAAELAALTVQPLTNGHS